jgi:thiamine-phosphate pyrophosphorylase
VLTDRRASEAAGRQLPATVAAVVAAGAPIIVLREKDLSFDERCRLGEALRSVVAEADARLVVASDLALAAHLDAWGVHLAASDSLPGLGAQPVADRKRLAVGRSCHNRAEVMAAAENQLDWITLSPVYLTSSKPGYGPALETDGLAQLAALAGGPPAIALGGIDARRVAPCLAAGAHGVAVMGAVMGAGDPASVTADLLGVLARVAGASAQTTAQPRGVAP